MTGRLHSGEYTLVARERPATGKKTSDNTAPPTDKRLSMKDVAQRALASARGDGKEASTLDLAKVAAMLSSTGNSSAAAGPVDLSEMKGLKAKMDRIEEMLERMDRSSNRVKVLTVAHKGQVRQLKVLAGDEHHAVDAGLRGVFGLLPSMDYVLLDSDSRPECLGLSPRSPARIHFMRGNIAESRRQAAGWRKKKGFFHRICLCVCRRRHLSNKK